MVPLAVVASAVFVPASEVWDHLAATVLGRYLTNTGALVVGVGALTLAIGVATAWLVTMCRFPGRGVFEWALLLPLAMPAYVIAYTYGGMFDYAGPVQSALRAWFGWTRGDYWFPPVRSVGGAVVLLGLVLYPYVYMLARAAFLEQSVCVLEVGRTLGSGPWRTFRKIGLPLARPAVVAGVALALMEALGDFGAVQYLAVDTFTTGIFRTWYGLGDLAAATQLAAMLLGFVFLVLALERVARGGRRFHPHVGAVPAAAAIPPARCADGGRRACVRGACVPRLPAAGRAPRAVGRRDGARGHERRLPSPRAQQRGSGDGRRRTLRGGGG